MFRIRTKNKALYDKLEIQDQKYNELLSQFSFLERQYFDGEKEAGELGPAVSIYPDYYSARERAWELQLTNDIAKLVINKWVTWLIGKGLRFNATPPKDEYLSQNTDRNKLIKDIEFRFRNYLTSRYSDYSQMLDFHKTAKNATYNAITGGDVLAVLRVKNKQVTIQLIDGAVVSTPSGYDGDNEILDGVEFNEKGKHVAYHVLDSELEHVRIPAVHGSSGLKMAFLIYGSKFRLNETRGTPLLLENFEKIKNLERYIDATVKSAEISSELAFINEHDNSSTGENIFKNSALKAIKTSTVDYSSELPSPSCFQNNLAKSTKGIVLNNTIGAELKMLKPDGEATMPDFLEANLKLTFASGGIPYEVAMSVYNSNYSASRAAIKDWEHNLNVKTEEIASQIYKPFYDLWLYNEILTGRVSYPELLTAYSIKDYVMLSALTKATFTGVSVPSIDPLKEVKAVRSAMGDEITPLMTGEQGAEIVSQMDFTEIQEIVKQERLISVKPIKNTEDEL